jgi:aryl-alcohol dehydrogenase-like predicted oxidoreductase
VAYSPLGRGFLTGRFQRYEDLPEGDWRRNSPRFKGDNFAKNLTLLERVRAMAAEKGVTPAQLGLAWVLHRGDDIAPIPGTKQRRFLEENVKAVDLRLSPEDLRRLDEIAPKGSAAGNRYPDMSLVNR